MLYSVLTSIANNPTCTIWCSMLDRIVRAIQFDTFDIEKLPVAKTWDELSRNVEKHIIAHVQVISRSRRPERLVIHNVHLGYTS